jgi:prolyl-tRNA synthetase
MPDGQALQSGTTHYFGDGFAKAFNIEFTDKNNQISHPHQTSWGVSTRLLGAIIMVHGDDDGLVLPPFVAPIQIVIVPIGTNEDVIELAKSYEKQLSEHYRVVLDTSDRSPGWKFAEYEMKGVPVRIEIGPRDLLNDMVTISTRYNGEKTLIQKDKVVQSIPKLLQNIHEVMLLKAQQYVTSHTFDAKDYDSFKTQIKEGGYVGMAIHPEAEAIIKQETTATARVIPFNQPKTFGLCPVTSKQASTYILFARAY